MTTYAYGLRSRLGIGRLWLRRHYGRAGRHVRPRDTWRTWLRRLLARQAEEVRVWAPLDCPMDPPRPVRPDLDAVGRHLLTGAACLTIFLVGYVLTASGMWR